MPEFVNDFFNDFSGDAGGPGPLFLVVTLFMFAVLALFIGAFTFGIIRALLRWNRNNKSPLVTVPASVIAKRGHVSGGSGDTSSSTSYYVTFEVRGGERQEIQMTGPQFGTLIEGDRGHLSTQGTRYKGFTRTPQDR
ncbi:MAG TPA: DUF2500 domain-containing protein [Kineosporiaceae bacterium]|nr:DUF2500 domain-containing protein [Kineosporiaceae bacterium]